MLTLSTEQETSKECGEEERDEGYYPAGSWTCPLPEATLGLEMIWMIHIEEYWKS